jgi:hypothetical protein
MQSDTMSTRAAAFALMLGLLSCSKASATFELDFSSNTGTAIVFDGNSHFSFSTDTNGFNFTVTDEFDGGNDSALGLKGNITGVYGIGTISTSGILETAPVTTSQGPATFTITDANNFQFSATVGWIQIGTIGTTGSLNLLGQVNLSDITYAGSNSDLLLLASEANQNGGIATISFQSSNRHDLNYLAANSFTTSYSGSVSGNEDSSPFVVPAPAPPGIILALTGLPLLGLGWLRRRVKRD